MLSNVVFNSDFANSDQARPSPYELEKSPHLLSGQSLLGAVNDRAAFQKLTVVGPKWDVL